MTEETIVKPAIAFDCPHCQAANFAHDTLEFEAEKDGIFIDSDAIQCVQCGKDIRAVRPRVADDRFLIRLSAHGNPDHGEDPKVPVVKSRPEVAPTLAEASRICRAFIEQNNLGAGNWSGGQVYNQYSNEHVYNISYNGRVWRLDGSEVSCE